MQPSPPTSFKIRLSCLLAGLCLLSGPGVHHAGGSPARYGGLELDARLLEKIPADHVLIYKADIVNEQPFPMRGYLKDHYMLQLAESVPGGAAVTPDPAGDGVRVSVTDQPAKPSRMPSPLPSNRGPRRKFAWMRPSSKTCQSRTPASPSRLAKEKSSASPRNFNTHAHRREESRNPLSATGRTSHKVVASAWLSTTSASTVQPTTARPGRFRWRQSRTSDWRASATSPNLRPSPCWRVRWADWCSGTADAAPEHGWIAPSPARFSCSISRSKRICDRHDPSLGGG